MTSKYSISQARDQLARLVHEAEAGRRIELTRRGEPVAVVLAIDEFRRLSEPRSSVWAAVSAFRSAHDLAEMDEVVDQVAAGSRSEDLGRDFSW